MIQMWHTHFHFPHKMNTGSELVFIINLKSFEIAIYIIVNQTAF